MDNLLTLHLGALGTNCYLVPSGEGHCVIIDIGDGAAKLRETLLKQNLTLDAILLTHGHYDHVAGVEEIRNAYQIPVYIHEADENCLRSGQANLAYQLTSKQFIPVKEYQTIRDGDTLSLGELTVEVMHTPGHTPGGVCYQIGDSLFTGDTLFAGGIGRIDLGGNAQEMRSSLLRLAGIPEDFEIYPGHGPGSSLDWERKHNPYMGGGI